MPGLSASKRYVRLGMASCGAKVEDLVLGSLGHRGSNHIPIKGKTKKEEGA
jgi:hypothetical protein